ncbi:MAG: TlpA disulfide reductase family protein [Xanthomonadales bacterium]|nr:TlpA disulfide reductase family protein [Xanthomonadales bacterium]
MNAWRALRRRPILSLLVDVAVIVLVLGAIHAWNTHSLSRGPMPPLDAPALAAFTDEAPSGVGVVYFFAPWCVYCRHSMDNLEALRAEGVVAWTRAVALEYESLASIHEFLDETGYRGPVLLGDRDTSRNWGIRAFPTYFVIGSDGRIASRSVGYSTRAGLWLRAKLAD